MYRLLAIDLDGTLLTPQKLITPRTRDLLCQVSETGIAIVIATGQTSQVLCHECRALPLTAPQIIENGAIVSLVGAVGSACISNMPNATPAATLSRSTNSRWK